GRIRAVAPTGGYVSPPPVCAFFPHLFGWVLLRAVRAASSRTVTGGAGSMLRGEDPGRSRISRPSVPPDRAAEGGTLRRGTPELPRPRQGALARLTQAEGNRSGPADAAGLQLPRARLERGTGAVAADGRPIPVALRAGRATEGRPERAGR